MDKNSQNTEKKMTNRAVTVAVVILLCLMAILVGVGTALNRRDKTPAETTVVTGSTEPAVTSPRLPQKTTVFTQTTPAVGTLAPVSPVAELDVLPEFFMPVSGSLTSLHDTDVLVYSTTMNDYRVHCGIDIAAALGDCVYAAADGTVAEIWSDPLMGTCLSLDHAGDSQSVYRNLAPELAEGLEVGSYVSAGDLIGAVGETAVIEIAEEPHLHFEMKVGGVYVNPVDYLPVSETALPADTSYES